MARKKRDEEDPREQHDTADGGTDWLLAQLVTGRTSESQQQPPDSTEPPAAPVQPDPEAPAAAEPDLPLRPPAPRREEELDWFSLAEPPTDDAATRALPVVGEPAAPAETTPPTGVPAWSPPFVSAPPSAPTEHVTRVEPPVGEAAGPVEPPPGPVTPTGPFALRWGSNEPAAGESGEVVEPPMPTPPAAATTPDSAPRGWDERAAEPAPAPYDDELWAALNEADAEPDTPRSDDSASTPIAPTHPGVALNLPLAPPAGAAQPPAAPVPAFGSRDQSAEPQGGEQIDDLLAELGNRWAAREAGAEPADQGAPNAPHADDDVDDARGGDEPAGQPTGAEPAEGHSPIAKQVAEAGYFWNLTPDPTAADPVADDSSAAATINRLRATSPESESEVEAEPEAEPGVEWQPEPESEPEPEFDWQSSPESESDYSDLPFGHPEPDSESAFGSGASDRREPDTEPDDHDPLAALFGGAAAVATPPARPTAPITDPFAYLAPLPAATAGAPSTPAATPAGAPAGVTTPARSAYDVAGTAPGGGSGGSGGPGTTGSGTRGRRNSPARVLAWIAGGLAAVLVLAGLFWLGTQLGGGTAAPAESPVASATPTPTPEPTAAQPAGVHAWNTLFGGECLEPFVGPWEEEFTVVDCAAPHAAQLVYRGVLPGDAGAPFPGEAELASQMNLLCTATGVINLAAVAGMEDLQVQASYPVTEAQWAEGERNYYCFANRAGGEPLTASIAGPGPAA